ncbi:glycerol-3-phosphate dehydrogenase subunit GlpB [Halapricum desulfuricans]|uniref:Anaerobic glycerol-3-phosphate dehydrogenase n=1 Tax=Halapricum desulfuricans TaxID=2841257 RepID=A0A897NSK8_9EURY|nr:glycerol-3-phosphate dehydrogenase subunit GlpB [Halapricum desulfuricans]QSG15414.1 Anaerobic glycerol-3-phosphate dehydrogenase [Halapricum desulfuricans]
MAIESDVLVIGGGLAGLSSAISAAREGADVRLVTYKQSTLRQASGLIDVLGYTPNGEGPLTDPYDAIPELPEEHPYRIVGEDTVRDAMSMFDAVVDTYRGGHTDTNALLPTYGGTVKPTARYPDGAAAGLASDDRDLLLVGFEAMPDFDAPHVAAHLEAAGVPFDVRGETIQFPGDLMDDAKVTRYAKLLENNGPVEVRGRERGARDALVERLNPLIENEQRIGLPAVLGDADAAGVRAALEAELGTEVFEVPATPPSLPGVRLEDRLFEALDEVGGNFESGNPVVSFDGQDRVETVYVDKQDARIPFSAEQYVLATGGLVGKGVESDREHVYEPIFDCHVAHSEDRYDWFDEDVFGDHPFAGFGVDPDPELRPLDGSGSPEFENLRAAGSVLGGYDFAAEKSGSGVSIATGYHAGRIAAQEAQ